MGLLASASWTAAYILSYGVPHSPHDPRFRKVDNAPASPSAATPRQVLQLHLDTPWWNIAASPRAIALRVGRNRERAMNPVFEFEIPRSHLTDSMDLIAEMMLPRQTTRKLKAKAKRSKAKSRHKRAAGSSECATDLNPVQYSISNEAVQFPGSAETESVLHAWFVTNATDSHLSAVSQKYRQVTTHFLCTAKHTVTSAETILCPDEDGSICKIVDGEGSLMSIGWLGGDGKITWTHQPLEYGNYALDAAISRMEGLRVGAQILSVNIPIEIGDDEDSDTESERSDEDSEHEAKTGE